MIVLKYKTLIRTRRRQFTRTTNWRVTAYHILVVRAECFKKIIVHDDDVFRVVEISTVQKLATKKAWHERSPHPLVCVWAFEVISSVKICYDLVNHGSLLIDLIIIIGNFLFCFCFPPRSKSIFLFPVWWRFLYHFFFQFWWLVSKQMEEPKIGVKRPWPEIISGRWILGKVWVATGLGKIWKGESKVG